MTEGVSEIEVQNAVSQGMTQIAFIWSQVYTLLSQTEVFDAEMSMELIDTMRLALKKSSELLRDKLHQQGITDEMINAQAEIIRKMMGF